MAKNASSDDNMMGMLAHLLGIFTGFIGPLVIYLIQKDKGGNSLENAKHSLNFQISLMIYYVICFILVFVLIGFLLMIALGIFAIVNLVVASVKAYNGEVYKYPLEIKFIK
jgi:uncharacterized Tic20 family protein